VDVFQRSTDGALWWRQLTQAAGWSAWQSFGGNVTSDPTAVAGPDGEVYIFVRGADNAVWMQLYNGTSWSGWRTLGGTATSDIVSYADSTGVYVFVRGFDNGLYWGTFSGATWSGWRSAGGSLAGRPAVTGDSSGVYAFVIAPNNGIWVQHFSTSAGNGFIPLGGSTNIDIAAAADSSGVAVYARGTDGALFRSVNTGGGFTAWQSLGGLLTSAPAAVGSGSTTNLFVRGLDNALYWQPVTSGTPGGWRTLGGNVTSNATAAADAGGVTVFVRGLDGMLWGQRYEGSWPGWSGIGGVPVASDPYAISAPQINAAPPAPGSGLGFDTCQAPSTSAMQTWRLASPYTSIGIYIGGENRACSNTVLNNSSWVNTVAAQGWKLLPLYVGLQAPCINFSSTTMSSDVNVAYFQGAVDANNAANAAAAAGLPHGSPIYFDMEAYNNSTLGCAAPVWSFVSAWVIQLHSQGYVAGMYGSLCSGIDDQAALSTNPAYAPLDAVWIAAWNNTPNLTGFTGTCALSDSLWPFHQRIHQYVGGHNETYGGVTMNIDNDVVDGPVAP
jgi:hypothetical protein